MYATVLLEALPGKILGFDQELVIEVGIQWINTIILIVIMSKFLYKPVKQFMSARSERISKQIRDAGEAEQLAKDMKEDYEGKLRDIERERGEILTVARKRATDKTEELLFQAREEADQFRARAQKDIELAEEKVKDEMKRQIIEISTLLAGRFATISLDRQTQDRLIDEAIADMGGVKWLR
ncbi:MAG: F0F1 ATP synthase subunit B [Clostridiales bacterium]|jgi:F-type H+-transporting ATPase subunit b|nr:F0F1 ATP synthase subunit B [Clostridiales bacterium]